MPAGAGGCRVPGGAASSPRHDDAEGSTSPIGTPSAGSGPGACDRYWPRRPPAGPSPSRRTGRWPHHESFGHEPEPGDGPLGLVQQCEQGEARRASHRPRRVGDPMWTVEPRRSPTRAVRLRRRTTGLPSDTAAHPAQPARRLPGDGERDPGGGEATTTPEARGPTTQFERQDHDQDAGRHPHPGELVPDGADRVPAQTMSRSMRSGVEVRRCLDEGVGQPPEARCVTHRPFHIRHLSTTVRGF